MIGIIFSWHLPYILNTNFMMGEDVFVCFQITFPNTCTYMLMDYEFFFDRVDDMIFHLHHPYLYDYPSIYMFQYAPPPSLGFNRNMSKSKG